MFSNQQDLHQSQSENQANASKSQQDPFSQSNPVNFLGIPSSQTSQHEQFLQSSQNQQHQSFHKTHIKTTHEGYDPSKSTTSPEAMRTWLSQPVVEDIRQIPGIGDKNAEILSLNNDIESGISTTFELLGKYLMLRKKGMTPTEHCDRFWSWLKTKHITSHKDAIVQACAERCNLMFPGIYDGFFIFNTV
jgi:hypothetical protein